MLSDTANKKQGKNRTVRAALLRRFGVYSDDRGLATTETVVLTAFLVVVASAGGLIIYNAVNSRAEDLQQPANFSIPPVATTQ